MKLEKVSVKTLKLPVGKRYCHSMKTRANFGLVRCPKQGNPLRLIRAPGFCRDGLHNIPLENWRLRKHLLVVVCKGDHHTKKIDTAFSKIGTLLENQAKVLGEKSYRVKINRLVNSSGNISTACYHINLPAFWYKTSNSHFWFTTLLFRLWWCWVENPKQLPYVGTVGTLFKKFKTISSQVTDVRTLKSIVSQAEKEVLLLLLFWKNLGLKPNESDILSNIRGWKVGETSKRRSINSGQGLVSFSATIKELKGVRPDYTIFNPVSSYYGSIPSSSILRKLEKELQTIENNSKLRVITRQQNRLNSWTGRRNTYTMLDLKFAKYVNKIGWHGVSYWAVRCYQDVKNDIWNIKDWAYDD